MWMTNDIMKKYINYFKFINEDKNGEQFLIKDNHFKYGTIHFFNDEYCNKKYMNVLLKKNKEIL